jgi:hypothetical protein
MRNTFHFSWAFEIGPISSSSQTATAAAAKIKHAAADALLHFYLLVALC